MRQKGFTLIEIVVVLAVGGIVMAGIMLGIFQVSWGSVRTNDQVIALTDLTYAARWVKGDIQMAQSTDLTPGVPESSVTLSWIDQSGPFPGNEPEEQKNHSSSYRLSGTELLCTYDGVESVVGKHITAIGFTQNDRVVDVVITATGPGIGQQSETISFSVLMRTEETE